MPAVNSMYGFLEKHGLKLVSLFFVIVLLAILVLMIAYGRGPFEMILVLLIVGGMELLILFFGLRSATRYRSWRYYVPSQLGLNFRRGISPSLDGLYRNHYVEIYTHIRSMDEPWYTGYRVRFSNPSQVSIHVHEERVMWKIGKKLSAKITTRMESLGVPVYDIEVGDPEFDNRFRIEGNSENDIKAVLDQSIRNKIMTLKKVDMIIEGNIAQYEEEGSYPKLERLRLVLDLMIDVVGRIESR